jgi:hypothetical protein
MVAELRRLHSPDLQDKQSGPVNYLRDPFSADEWLANGIDNTISDMLMLDHFAEWAWVAGDHCRSAGERASAGVKILGAAALLAGGGQIIKGAGRALGAGASLGRGAPIVDDLIAAAQKLYPCKAGLTELHHITPKYLGGAADGRHTIR